MARRAGLQQMLVGAAAACLLISPGAAQSQSASRSIIIMEDQPAKAAPPSAQPGVPPVPVLVPAQPSPSRPDGAGNPAGVPALLPAQPLPPHPVEAAPASLPQPNVAVIQSLLRGKNSAGVDVELVPGGELQVGEKTALRVTTKKPGYLILVGIDATGKVAQIYPNRRSLLTSQDAPDSANLITPERALTIPDADVAEPPTGTAMVVAILSDRPVQMLDLPDIPASLAGRGAAVGYLSDWTENLRILRTDASGRFEQAHWSFDAKPYVIR